MRWLRPRDWIAAEAVLLVGVIKDVISDRVRTASIPGYAKVLFMMAATLGLLGGMYFVLERLLAHTVARTHGAARTLSLGAPGWLFHLALILVLFFVYAHMLGVRVV